MRNMTYVMEDKQINVLEYVLKYFLFCEKHRPMSYFSWSSNDRSMKISFCQDTIY